MVDEDPGSAKTSYEKRLAFSEEIEGIKCYLDGNGNRILYLTGKLEDWIIIVCKKEGIIMNRYGLPERPNDLHEIINHRLTNFDKVLLELIGMGSPALNALKSWLQ
jgi:hypothetical protein